MRRANHRRGLVVLVVVLIAGCGSSPQSSPLTSPSSGGVGPTPSLAQPTPKPTPSSGTPGPTGAATASPSPALKPASAILPVRTSAREAERDILMAPGPGGTLYVSIPRPGGSVLALLDPSGRPRPGWPIVIKDSTFCDFLGVVVDGSVRIVCPALDLLRDIRASDVRAFAFDWGGRLMAGWPVQLRPGVGRVSGDILTVFTQEGGTDVADPTGRVSHEDWVTMVAADGRIRSGVRVPMVETCCGAVSAVGPDGIAYGVAPVGEWDSGSSEMSRITALDLSGIRAGWPVPIDGIASGPDFGPGGRIVVTVGSFVQDMSRVLVFDSDGKAISAVSAELPMAIAESGADCVAFSPEPPIAAPDGTIFVFSEIDTAVYALDPSLEVMRGWPYRPATGRERPQLTEGEPGTLQCDAPPVRPAVGPDSILYLPLQARDATVGGSIVAVGSDGRVRPGWPVELRRPGAEIWSVVVGADGIAYAIAIEPETGNDASATILAIAPDSTVLYRTTVVDP